MRIEYEGVIEQQPTYSHVGYVSVASVRMNSDPAGQVGLGLATVGLMLGIMAYRGRSDLPRRSTILGIVGVLMLLSGGILAATNGGVTEKYYRAPYYETWGRLTVVERALDTRVATGRSVDAWSRTFKYDLDPGPEFGLPHNVISAGADGEFGTADDIDLSFSHRQALDYDLAMRGEKPWPERPEPHRYWKVGIDAAD